MASCTRDHQSNTVLSSGRTAVRAVEVDEQRAQQLAQRRLARLDLRTARSVTEYVSESGVKWAASAAPAGPTNRSQCRFREKEAPNMLASLA
jgi:hypothetical protein